MDETTTEVMHAPLEAASAVAKAMGKDPRSAKLCMLILTHSCNLNCSYCYEKFKSARKMSRETALSAFREQLQNVRNSSEYKWMLVDLFGGEPLLNFDVIRYLVEWVRENVRDIPVQFTISSNGTLLTDEIKGWLAANSDLVFYGVSYDGSAEAQLRNRGKANDSAVDFSKATWPSHPFRMTIPPESLESLTDSILVALKNGFHIRAELAGGIHWPKECAAVLLREGRKLKQAFMADKSLPTTLINRFFKGGEDADMCGSIACGCATRCTCYDIDGKKYGCQMFTPLTVGDKALPLEEVNLTLPQNREDPHCVGCPIRHWCPTCYGMNYVMRGHTALRDHAMCHMYLALALLTAEYQSELLASEPLTPESAGLLKFLLRIRKLIDLRLSEIS
ncbi:MAG: 4Fe-4S cluster-binding domain-containing protein [Akkermansia sp.]|nr:4Fe-4S cluster-binding domain-containing protein [Akkermansia sp.]